MRTAIFRAALVAFLYVQGISLGTLYLFCNQPGASVEPVSTPVVLETPDSSALLRVRTPQQHRQIAEQLLLSNDAFQALPHLLNAAPQPLVQANENLLFRIALCFEASRDWPRAIPLYRQIVTNTTDEALRATAKNGLARSRLKSGDGAAAVQLLWTPWLMSGDSSLPEQTNDALFLLIQVLTNNTQYELADLIIPDRPIGNVSQELDVSRELKQLIASRRAKTEQPAETSSANPSRPGQIKLSDIRKFGDKDSDTFLSIEARQTELLRLLEQTAVSTGIELQVSDSARKFIAGQPASVVIADTDLGSALDAQTLPFQLCWFERDGVFVVFTQAETPVAELDRAVQAAAMRMLQRAMLVSPDHHAWGHIKFTLASLKYRLGQRDQARQLFQELLDQPVGGKLRQAASFNLGNLYQQAGMWTEASAAYHNVVDANEPGEIQAIAWMRIGQLSLESGNLAAAIQEFSRASHISEMPRLRQLAQLRAASCQVLNGQPRMAEQTIHRHRHWFRNSDLRNAAGLVAAIAKLDLGKSRDIEEELLSMLTRNQWVVEQGHELLYLMEHGYRGFGFLDQAIAILDSANLDSMGPWLKYRMVVDRIEMLEENQQFVRAREATLRALERPDWQTSPALLMYLAEVELALGNIDAGLQLYRQILDREDDQLHSQALTMMGQIYAERGEHYHAALCFSGLLPHTETENPPDSIETPTN